MMKSRHNFEQKWAIVYNYLQLYTTLQVRVKLTFSAASIFADFVRCVDVDVISHWREDTTEGEV